MFAYQIHGSMFQHGKVFTLHHPIHERFGRIHSGIILTFIAYSSCSFYLLVDTELTWFL